MNTTRRAWLVAWALSPLSCANLEYVPPDGGLGDGFECRDQDTRCSGLAYQLCQAGIWATMKTCVAPKVCATRLKGCADCDPDMEHACKGGNVYACQANGTFGAKVKTCPNAQCAAGQCTDPCSVAEEKRSYVGCSYWPTVTINAGLPRDFSYAVVVANPSTTTAATVKVASKDNATLASATVAANSLTTITLPWVTGLKQSISQRTSTLVSNGAYHLTSSVPVTVYQFNPLQYKLVTECTIDEDPDPYDGVCSSHTNDASLLLPDHALGKKYMVVTRPSMKICQLGKCSGYPGFFAVVGTHAGKTKVDVTFSADTLASGGSIQAYKKGDKASFELEQWGVLEILADIPTCTPVKTDLYGWGYCDLSATTDLTGTEISTDQDVAVFVGHDCTFVPYDKWACDHLEEQIYPLSAWGKVYIGTHTLSSGNDPSVYRVVSAMDKNRITFNPTVHSDTTLDRGKWLEFESTKDFVAQGDGPFLLVQFMVGQGYSNPTPQTGAPGDPSLALAVPVEQFRTSYRFLAPDTYEQSYVNVIAPTGATVKLDGATIPASEFKPIGGVDSSPWMVAKLKISGGAHSVESTKKVGISVYGVASYTSYMYPGGLDLTELLK